MKRIIIALTAAAVLAVGAVMAWNLMDNSSVGTVRGEQNMVPRSEVEKQTEENFGRIFEDGPDSVSCPRGLRPKKHDTVRCAADFDGERKAMLISVTDVQDDKVSFDYGVLEGEKPPKPGESQRPDQDSGDTEGSGSADAGGE